MASLPESSFLHLKSLDTILLERERKIAIPKVHCANTSSPKRPASEFSVSTTSSLSTLVDIEASLTDSQTTLVGQERSTRRFRSLAAEVGFCFSIAVSQLLAEYLISGFGVLVPTLGNEFSPSGLSLFWPTSVLSLVISSMTLPFARGSDMHGGYPFFFLGLAWLSVWTLVAGFCQSVAALSICRAMQGLAIAAFQPATFALIGGVYPPGRRRNVVFGIYAACAPLGFYCGILVSGLAVQCLTWSWYFWITSIVSFVTIVLAFVSVPSDLMDRRELNLTMDWMGSGTIAAGLLLVAYALAASSHTVGGWGSPLILATFLGGLLCLCTAAYVELRVAKCPILPRDFFKPKGVTPFIIASVFFYGSFGVFLFYSMLYIADVMHASPLQLATWYTPMAICGFLVATIGGSICHKVPSSILMVLSGLAWILAPLLFAVSPPYSAYWSCRMPAMVCATFGVDLTYTLSSIFLTSVQPTRYQGLSGAICSVVVNLGISIFLVFADIVQTATKDGGAISSFRAVFWFGVGLAGMGCLTCLLFVRVPRKVGDFALRDSTSPLATPVERCVLPPRKGMLTEKSDHYKSRKETLSQADIDGWNMRVSGFTTAGRV